MRNFTYYNINETNLHIDVCEWLEGMGLKETLWIIDREWFFYSYDNMTFNKWTKK